MKDRVALSMAGCHAGEAGNDDQRDTDESERGAKAGDFGDETDQRRTQKKSDGRKAGRRSNPDTGRMW